VLNGTTVTGLARAESEKLTSLGFREGVVTNDTTNQNRPRTEIYYEPGYREQAHAVAGDRAEIVVFVGADKAK